MRTNNSFQLNNHWMESLDYRYHPIHVNKGTAKYGRRKEEGRICIVVSHQPPPSAADDDVNNYLSTVGHRFGTMCFRWIRLKSPDAAPPQPQTAVVKVAELSRYVNE